jgi:anaerobic magnesium-protoporphyrin IX monomethyl ester cyclase
LAGLDSRYPWKCATTLHHLDQELVAAMGRSGCVRISVGLETLDPGGDPYLPRIKRGEESRLECVAAWCAENGIELNCFVILGLPGTTPAGAAYTIERVRQLGARVRPTAYTPYQKMAGDMTEEQIGGFNRQIFLPGETAADEPDQWYSMLFGHEPAPTRVARRIPARSH